MIYTPEDVPVGTKVYVDGRLISKVFYVDTDRGIVDRFREPLKVHRHKKRLISERIRSKDIRLEFWPIRERGDE